MLIIVAHIAHGSRFQKICITLVHHNNVSTILVIENVRLPYVPFILPCWYAPYSCREAIIKHVLLQKFFDVAGSLG
jgi:hypothetical protein